MLFRRNNILYGMALAALSAFAVFGIMFLIHKYILMPSFGRAMISERVMAMTGLSANVIVATQFLNKRANASANGVMVFFLVGAAAIIILFFGKELGFSE